MNNRVLVKLIGLNLFVALLNISIYVDSIPGFSVTTENVFLKSISITFSVLSLILFVLGNKNLLPILSPPKDIIDVEEEESDTLITKRGEEFSKSLRNYRFNNIQISDLVNSIDSALDQISRVYRNKEKYIIILTRNGNTAKDLLQDGDHFKDSVLSNIKVILNNVTLLDGLDPNSSRDKDLFEEHLNRIRTILHTNEEILTKFKEMIRLVIDMDGDINKYDERLIPIVATLNELYRINYEEDK